MTARASPVRVADVKRILVLRPNAVGDFVLALPALHALRACYPQAEIIYLGKQWHAEFLHDRTGPIDRIAIVPACPGVGVAPGTQVDVNAIDHFVECMRALQADIAVQAYGGGEYSNPFLLRLGARLNIGLKAQCAPPLDRSVSFGTLQNRRLQLLEVTALVGADRLHMGTELQVTSHDRREAQQVLEGLDCDVRPLVVLHPASNDRRRCWSPDNFARLADALCEAGAQIAINGTGTETDLVCALMKGMRHCALDLRGRLSLSGLCGVLERAVLMVSNDSGPLHLALAIGTPAVGIYWLNNLIESGPLQQDWHRAVLSARTHCPVCGEENLRTRCAHDASFVDDVRFEEVFALAMELYRRSVA